MSALKKHFDQPLPDDPVALKKIIKAMAIRLAILEEYALLSVVKKFSASSEKSVDQHELFNEVELTVAAEDIAEQNANEKLALLPVSGRVAKKPGRKPLPKELPRVRIEHELSEAEKRCPCGCELSVIGEDTSEQLDIIPAKIQVLVNVRKKYACKQCEDGVKTAPLPQQPIPKSNASPGLLAHVAVSKYQDGLPLHRLEGILNRSGVEIPRSTLANWMMKAADLIQPLLDVLEGTLLHYPVLHCDETTVQVLNEKDKTPESTSYMWVRVGGPPTQPVRLFHYADSRRGSVACGLLEGYQGYLQTDDYAGYNAAALHQDITQLGCWAHARRKFIEAQKASGKGKVDKATVAVGLIAKLYAIEKSINDQGAETKYLMRQQQSVPQLQKIRDWLDKTLHSTLPKGLLGKALSYLDKNWDKLTVYPQDGRLCIDNNPAENAIRPFVIGRKNWLFSASVKGACASAALYSLIETAKANGLEPYQYLRHVFTELPKAGNQQEIEGLLPWAVTLQDGVY